MGRCQLIFLQGWRGKGEYAKDCDACTDNFRIVHNG